MKKENKKETEKASRNVVKKENVKKKTAEKGNKKEKKSKGNIFSRIGRYFRGVAKEIKRIKWTSGKELVKYSLASICFLAFFGLYFYIIDVIVVLIRSLR